MEMYFKKFLKNKTSSINPIRKKTCKNHQIKKFQIIQNLLNSQEIIYIYIYIRQIKKK